MRLSLHEVVKKMSTVIENDQENSTYVRRLRNKILCQSMLDCLFFERQFFFLKLTKLFNLVIVN